MPVQTGVFSLVLKVSIEGAHLIAKGKLFHRRGAATEKARSPLPFNRDRGAESKSCSEDLSVLVLCRGQMRSVM